MFEQLNARVTEGGNAEPITKILDTPLKVKNSPARLAHDILMHNENTKYSQVGVVGLPGSGKTTLVNCLLHSLHTKDPSYNVHHFKKDDILKLEKILDEMPKRQNCILVFDDVSYLFEQIGEKKVAEILHSLTIVREKIDPQFKQTKCIVFLLFHYSYALVKGLRTTNFRIICSVSDEEFENYRKVLGYHNSKHIFDFTKKFLSMMRYNKFKIQSNTDEPFVYYTNNPFRLALVSNLGELHYTLYHKAGCALCQPHRDKKTKFDAPNSSLWDEVLRKYGFNQVSSTLATYAFVNARKPTVNKNFRAVWRYIEAEHRFTRLDLLQLALIFRQAKKIEAPTTKELFAKRHEFIVSKLKEMELTAKENESKVVTDSLENVTAEALQGDESSINIEFEDNADFDSADEDEGLEADLDSDSRLFGPSGGA